MTEIDLKLDLPGSVAREAKAAGLLREEIREPVRKARRERA
jgi:hypothetical protein